jgi:hypothetical protein
MKALFVVEVSQSLKDGKVEKDTKYCCRFGEKIQIAGHAREIILNFIKVLHLQQHISPCILCPCGLIEVTLSKLLIVEAMYLHGFTA